MILFPIEVMFVKQMVDDIARYILGTLGWQHFGELGTLLLGFPQLLLQA
jgi:hypothetical protein